MGKGKKTRALRIRDPFSVLVADDDDDYRGSLQELLEGEGYQVRTVDCGTEALDLVRTVPIHVGILDMHMPDVTGIEIISSFASMPKVIPAILITADHSKETRMKAMGVGAFTVVTKPFTPQIVKRTVRQIILKFYENA